MVRRLGALVCVLGWLLGGFVSAHAQDVQPVPTLSGRVIDTTATLTGPQAAALAGKLAEVEAATGAQIVVLVVGRTQPEDIAAFAQRVADTWKLGRRDVGDGLLILVAKDDRRVRIEVAKTLEGAVPDLAARQVIDRAIKPAFQAGDYAGGLNAAVDQLAERIRSEGLPAPSATAPRSAPGLQWEELAIFFFAGVPILGSVFTGLFGRKLGSLVTAGAAGGMGWWLSTSALVAGATGLMSLLVVGLLGIGAARRSTGRSRVGGLSGRGSAPVIWTGGGAPFGGGWGGGTSDGGGFSSGGGGDFGGGGASGDW